MTQETFSKAYSAKNLMGSYFTAPLRAYNEWFQIKINNSASACEHAAWTICHIASGIFAYLTLGLVAFVGISINVCFISLQNEYSLWARLSGVPQATNELREKIRRELESACNGRGNSETMSASTSGNRWYTYNLQHQLSFDVQNVFDNASGPLAQAGGQVIEDTEKVEIIPCQQEDDKSLQIQSRLQRMEPHIVYIQSVVCAFSQKYGWYPEKQCIRTINNRVTVIIPLPDHIPVPNVVN